MSDFVRRRARQFRQIGAEYGRDLAAALVLAVDRGADRHVEQQMAHIVLREIDAATERFRVARLPEFLVATYERACRESCRAELLPAIERRLAAARGIQTARAEQAAA